MSRVFALTDDRGVIIDIEGGITTPSDLTGWTLVDEGVGDRYGLCQTHYLPMLLGEDGVYNYKLVDGVVTERSEYEKESDRLALAQLEQNRPASPGEIGFALLDALNR